MQQPIETTSALADLGAASPFLLASQEYKIMYLHINVVKQQNSCI